MRQIIDNVFEISIRLICIITVAAILSLCTGAFCLLIAYISFATKIVPIIFYGFALPPMFVVALTSLFVGFKILVWDDFFLKHQL